MTAVVSTLNETIGPAIAEALGILLFVEQVPARVQARPARNQGNRFKIAIHCLARLCDWLSSGH